MSQHVAILNKKWGMLDKILVGTKTIESRWLKQRSAPWGRIKEGETVYFKNSGEAVSVMGKVKSVVQYSNLNKARVTELLNEYAKRLGIEEVKYYAELFAAKRYVVMIELTDIKQIEPFEITKKGFGLQSAWLTVEDINTIKL